MVKEQASARFPHIPQESPGRGEAPAPLHIPSGPNASRERKTRESVPPTGQQRQDLLLVQGPGHLPQGQPPGQLSSLPCDG